MGYQLRASGIKRETYNRLRSGLHDRGYLPHVKREGASYFVTFRLADSLPRDVMLKLMSERAERLRCVQAKATAEDLDAIERDYARQIEEYLDRGTGKCELRRVDIAELVAQAIQFFDGDRYVLRAWVIMPNHVHVVFFPKPNHTVSAIVKSWKSFTALRANRILQRTGQPFWQPESYDHWIRNDEEHLRCCRYVHNNPVKAGLSKAPEEWRWSSAWPGWTAQK